MDVSVHKTSEGRHRTPSPSENRTRHLCCAPRDSDEETGGGTLGTEDGLHPRTTLSTNRCHLKGAAVGINCHDRDDTAIREEYIVEGPIGALEALLGFAANMYRRGQ